ncbi:hypothetical protein DFP93_101243 [Aneurinibacillus soli]|uniref:Uncharacterized protein n=1 Tax=Aneurinibacillus soli TaxID=1500254 RepID=A0A0U5B9B3_9BACL|nr:hypothetical protein [Aneurinibacillus soli]PYE64217.1 hypothetical protein DFP93_101243 [Aneurinibacillus soli]BAU28166.1 hypothetical protein CB4_02340 [Aneurinibacillus soli]
MAGIVNDYLIYPVLDLIKAGVKDAMSNVKDAEDGIDFFNGIPSVELIRDHPNDSSKTFLTQVIQTYENGYVMSVRLLYGDDSSPYHKWRLSGVISSLMNEEGELVLQHELVLLYGERNEVKFADVTCLYGPDDWEDEGEDMIDEETDY